MQPGDTGQAYPQTCGGKYMSKMNIPVWYGVSSGPCVQHETSALDPAADAARKSAWCPIACSPNMSDVSW